MKLTVRILLVSLAFLLLVTSTSATAESDNWGWVTPDDADASSEGFFDNLENGWVYAEVDTDGTLADGGNDSEEKTEGDASRELMITGATWKVGDYMEISKTFDLTDVSGLQFDVHSEYGWGGSVISIYIDSTQEENWVNVTGWNTREITQLNYSGDQTVKLRWEAATDIGGATLGSIWFDYLRITQSQVLETFDVTPPEASSGVNWTWGENDTNAVISYQFQPSVKKEGTASWELWTSGSDAEAGDFGQMTKSFNLSGSDVLEVWMAGYHANTETSVLIDNVEMWSKTGYDASWTWTDVDIYITGLTGMHDITVRAGAIGVGKIDVLVDYMRVSSFSSGRTIDDNTVTQWRPIPENEIGAWISWDLKYVMGIRGARIYWGADENYRPTAYHIQTSLNNVTWTTVVTETEAALPSAWKEYSWSDNLTQYIRLMVDTHGMSGTEIYEMDAESYSLLGWILIEDFENNSDWTGGTVFVQKDDYFDEGYSGYVGGSWSQRGQMWAYRTNPVSLTEVTRLSFWTKYYVMGAGGKWVQANFEIDNDSAFPSPVTLWSEYDASGVENITVDVSAYSGDYYLRFRITTNATGGAFWNTGTFWFDTLKRLVDWAPTIENITSSNSLIDRDLDDSSSGAVVSTTITLRVQDNDNRDDISAVYISIRDNNDSLVVDNVQVTDNTVVDENTSDFTYVYNPVDNLLDDNLGTFDVDVLVEDLWDENDTNNWGGDGASLFTVDDDNTAINFEFTNPYYRWEENASGVVSRIIGTASVDNIWYADAVEGTWYLGDNENWTKDNYIINSLPGENVTVTVTIWDPPLDGVVTSSYVVNENWKFWLNLKWEENFDLVPNAVFDNTFGDNYENIIDRNWWASFIHEAAETVEIQLDWNQYEFVDSIGSPLFVRITDKDENYFRTYRVTGKEIDVYMVTDNNLPLVYFYTIKIDDPTTQWGPPNGSIGLYKYENTTRVYINDAYWSGTSDTTAYLIYGHIYRIRLEAPNMTPLDYGIFDADVNTNRTLSPTSGIPSYGAVTSPITSTITWSHWWTDNNLTIQYDDSTENTNWVAIRITDENQTIVYTDNVWLSGFQSTWNNGNPSLWYLILLEVDHDLYGEPTSTSVNFGDMPTPIPQPSGSPPYLNVLGEPPVPWGNLIIAGLFLLILVAFGPGHAGIGAIMVGLTAAMLMVLGMVSISVEYIALIILFGFLIQYLESGRGGGQY